MALQLSHRSAAGGMEVARSRVFLGLRSGRRIITHASIDRPDQHVVRSGAELRFQQLESQIAIGL